MDRSDYHRYLASREWALLKEEVRTRSGDTCERCEKAPYQETHHVTYERLGHEDLDDLMAVCSPCHRYLSGKTDWDPTFVEVKPDWNDCGCYECECGVLVRVYQDSGGRFFHSELQCSWYEPHPCWMGVEPREAGVPAAPLPSR